MKNFKSIDEYIKSFSPQQQKVLTSIRQTIHEVIPDAQEKISYGIPTIVFRGKNIVHFAAYAGHYGFYPGYLPLKTMAQELSAYKTSKGTVQFPLDQPIPHNLIRKLTKLSVVNAKKK